MSASNTFLAHYGVQGMKWGVRKEYKNSPTKVKTAIKSKQDARREAEALEYDRQATTYQKRLDAVENKPGIKNSHKEWLLKNRDEAQANAQKVRESTGLTPHQKKIAKGAAVAVGVLAAYGTYRMVQSGHINQSIMRGKALIEGRGNPPFKIKEALASKDYDVFDLEFNVLQQINPGRIDGKIGTGMNCRRCTFAYELRRRGYDVMATRTTNAFGQNSAGLFNAIDTQHPNLKTSRYNVIKQILKEQRGEPDGFSPVLSLSKNFGAGAIEKLPVNKWAGKSDSIFDTLNKQPDGARGEIGVTFFGGFGHSMVWEKVKGTAVIFDAQTNTTYKPGTDKWKAMFDNIQDGGITRLDHIELDTDFLLRWVKDAEF